MFKVTVDGEGLEERWFGEGRSDDVITEMLRIHSLHDEEVVFNYVPGMEWIDDALGRRGLEAHTDAERQGKREPMKVVKPVDVGGKTVMSVLTDPSPV